MNMRNLFAWILTGLVVIITIMCLLGIWDIINWDYLKQYFGKTIQSLIVIVISGVVIYIINALFSPDQPKIKTGQEHKIVD